MSLHEHKPGFPPSPRGLQTIGMLLFLAALFMLFTSSMMAYVFIRINTTQPVAPHAVQPPQLLWVSTALILGVSICFHGAIKAVRRERQAMMRRWLTLAIICAAGFLLVQTPALAELLQQHNQAETKGLVLMYGLVFIFITVHALHVLGGMIGLGVVVRRGFKGEYDHEHHYGLSNAAMYWHFLDAVWLVMFSIFWFLG
jgi:cytochrome c oxidase subunit III